MNPLLSPFLSGFRNLLLRLIDKCKSNIDDGGISGALLTDLSKAFDCLSYRLLVAKLNAYGLNPDACMLTANNFINRITKGNISLR